MKIKVENAYEDGHESTLEYDIPDEELPADQDEFHDLLWEYGGDGHGMGNDLGMIATITIIEASDESLVGATYEIGG